MGVAGENGGEVDGARAFRSVEAPNGFRAERIHVHRFGAVAPAGGYGEGETDRFAGKERVGGRGFGGSTDTLIGDDTFQNRAVSVADRRRDKFGGGFSEGESLIFKGFTDSSKAAVDGGADADFDFMIGTAHKGIVDARA